LEREVGAKSRLREPERRAIKKSIRDIERSRVDSSRDRESTVREFELDSGVIPTVKSETNKESGN
jgi:hypothetical protein